ncbi:Bug family tripartite tricarboxylate transporter substrate binding protein [Comamonas terrigena]|uniref:Bug family tripartite tricarboxylate transporter substrate binding protein n=1 Tax=Comamonas terrigena TaxID=32013 RepID=UPI0024479473|nr:tripartite tricarboxylate transporter substrate binding protein [Comamonas terrigena]MDH1704276.1 tripartite tricarboxylate transporter substrate binding protein [Comamonas terrigena]
MQRRQLLKAAAAPLVLAGLPAVVKAQGNWPAAKNITYMVPFATGGTTDTLGRLIAQQLGPALGTTVIVENRGGAGGSVGSELAARAQPDGYTLLGGTISSHAINISLYPKLGYDPVKSFTPITLIGTNPLVLVVAANSPYKSLQDVLEAAKKRQGGLSSASAGAGTSQHLALEMLGWKSGVKFTHVPYKGSGPAIQDVMGGQVDMMFDTTVVAAPHIQSGKLRALAVTSKQRLEALKDVPTVAESGVSSLANFEVTSWQALFAPSGTPDAIVQKLHQEVAKIIATPDMKARLKTMGMEPSTLSPAQIAEFQKTEVAKWAAVIKEAKVKVDS